MNYIDAFNKYAHSEERFIVVTLAAIRGSAPQIPGAKIIVTNDGLKYGSVGGGKIENHAIKYSLELLQKETIEAHLEEINLQKDLGMSCGGGITLFYESFNFVNWNIKIFGAGHVCQALVRVLMNLNCKITVFDDRTQWIDKLPISDKITAVNSSSINFPKLNKDDYTLVMTQGHGTDLPILEAIFKQAINLPYLGVIGSTVKSINLKRELLDRDVSQVFRDTLICPLGLPIGDNTPEEIAISITAQLLEYRK